ncbi:hypothetical protein ACLH0K_17195 [Arthrobacter sp. MPF02]|uniref:hypothetical protein n=1 Tax=Arthrobacter sp. MPF02 TaxID=3388492 RepID=UPI0039856958
MVRHPVLEVAGLAAVLAGMPGAQLRTFLQGMGTSGIIMVLPGVVLLVEQLLPLLAAA